MRGDETGPHTFENSFKKAWTARSQRAPSLNFANAVKANPTVGASQTIAGADAMGGASTSFDGVLPYSQIVLTSDFGTPFLAFDGASYRWIVGNPPFRGFEQHVDHALTLGRHVAFLLRLAVLESAGRVECWSRWPLRRVWCLAERPSFTGSGTDSAAYGFFWFDRMHTGPAEIVPGWSWRSA